MQDLEISYADSDDVANDQPSLYLARAGYTQPADPVPTPRVVPTSEDWSNPIVNTSAIALIAEEQGLLSAVGLQTDRADLFFDEGTAFLKIGHDNALAERARLDALPSMEAGIAAFQATIASENRRDTLVNMCEYRINAAGKLDKLDRATGTGGADLSEIAWRQLAASTGGQNINKGLSSHSRVMRRVRARDLPKSGE